MKKTILFFVLDKYSDWESAYVSCLINALGESEYAIKTFSLSKEPVKSLGGFTLIPDYDLATAPKDFEGLILIGGMSWRTESAKKVKPFVKIAFENKKILGGICDAAGFLATTGVLNNIRHTGNDLNDIKQWAGDSYSGEEKYILEPAICDKNIITANGTAPLEFALEVLKALKVAPEQKILEWYNFHRYGFYEAPMPEI